MADHSTNAGALDFRLLCGRPPQAAADVPCQIGLIGDAIESNGGYRLTLMLPAATHVDLAMRDDRTVRIWSGNGEHPTLLSDYRLGMESPVPFDPVQAMTATLRRAGYDHPGFDACLTCPSSKSDAAPGPARVIGLLKALQTALYWKLSDEALARLAHQGGVDHSRDSASLAPYLAGAMGKPGTAWLLDFADEKLEPVVRPQSAEWLVLDTGVEGQALRDMRDRRRCECEAACALLGLRRIRDLEGAGRQTVLARIAALPSPLDARARHVVTENERALSATAWLEAGNFGRFGALLDASHESLRTEFELSFPESDMLFEWSREEPSVYGARLTCDGSGASVVMAVEAGAGAEVAARLAARFRDHCGVRGGLLLASMPAAA